MFRIVDDALIECGLKVGLRLEPFLWGNAKNTCIFTVEFKAYLHIKTKIVRAILLKTLALLILSLGGGLLLLTVVFNAAFLDIGEEIFGEAIGYNRSELLLSAKQICTFLLLFLPIVVWIGLIMLYSRKKTVLFLRKFGQEGSRKNMYGLLKQIQTQCRIVTLDDGKYAPRKFRKRDQAALIVGAAVVIFFCFLFLIVNYPILFDSSRMSRLDEINTFLTFSIFILSAKIIAKMSGLVVVKDGVRSQLRISNQEDLNELIEHTRQMNKWYNSVPFLFPISLVIKVTDNLWQSTVTASIAVYDIVLLDLSEPSQPIYWEYKQAKKINPERLILMADKSHFEQWLLEEKSAVEKTFQTELQQEEIFFYPMTSHDFFERIKERIEKIPKQKIDGRWEAQNLAFSIEGGQLLLEREGYVLQLDPSYTDEKNIKSLWPQFWKQALKDRLNTPKAWFKEWIGIAFIWLVVYYVLTGLFITPLVGKSAAMCWACLSVISIYILHFAGLLYQYFKIKKWLVEVVFGSERYQQEKDAILNGSTGSIQAFR